MDGVCDTKLGLIEKQLGIGGSSPPKPACRDACAEIQPPLLLPTAGAACARERRGPKACMKPDCDAIRNLSRSPWAIAAIAAVISMVVVVLVGPAFVRTRSPSDALALARTDPLRVVACGLLVGVLVVALPIATLKLTRRDCPPSPPAQPCE